MPPLQEINTSPKIITKGLIIINTPTRQDRTAAKRLRRQEKYKQANKKAWQNFLFFALPLTALLIFLAILFGGPYGEQDIRTEKGVVTDVMRSKGRHESVYYLELDNSGTYYKLARDCLEENGYDPKILAERIEGKEAEIEIPLIHLGFTFDRYQVHSLTVEGETYYKQPPDHYRNRISHWVFYGIIELVLLGVLAGIFLSRIDYSHVKDERRYRKRLKQKE